MSNTIPAIGVWCVGPDLLGTVHRDPEKDKDIALLHFTLRRLSPLGWHLHALIPWVGSLDHLAVEVVSWGFSVRRTSPQKGVAMRDLVAERMSPYGCLVDGAMAVIDADELRLAVARLDATQSTRYRSPRVDVRNAATWLVEEDVDAWPEPMDRLAAARFFEGQAPHTSAREIKARANERKPLIVEGMRLQAE